MPNIVGDILSKAMIKATTKIPISDIILDDEIYPRDGVDQKRVGIFAENIRDGFKFDPIEVQAHHDVTGKYRILDGVHRWRWHIGDVHWFIGFFSMALASINK